MQWVSSGQDKVPFPCPGAANGWQCPPGLKASRCLIAATQIPCAAQGAKLHGWCVWSKRVHHRACTKHLGLITPTGTKRHGRISSQEWVKHFSGPKTLPQSCPRNRAGRRTPHTQTDSLELSSLNSTSSLCRVGSISTGHGGVSILCARTDWTGCSVLPPTGSTELDPYC